MLQPELAELTGLSQSHISRIENAQRTPSVGDVERLLVGLKAPKQVRIEVTDLARSLATEFTSWRVLHRAGVYRTQEEYGEIEATARDIGIFHVAVVPGLLQTADYARAIINRATSETGETLERAVAARMGRQPILHDSTRRFTFVMLESALRLRVVPRDVMDVQIDRLISASTMRHVTLGVIPLDAELTVIPGNGFVVFDDVAVVVETLTAELTLRDPAHIASHREALQSFAKAALTGAPLRRFLQHLVATSSAAV